MKTGKTTHKGPIQTQFSESCAPTPDPKSSAGTSFGKAISEGPGPTAGSLKEVQYQEVSDKKGGGKISGS